MRPPLPNAVDEIRDPTARTALEQELADSAIVGPIRDPDDPSKLWVFGGSQGVAVYELASGRYVMLKRPDINQAIARPETEIARLGDRGEQWIRNEAAANEVAKLTGCEDLVIPAVLRTHTFPGGKPVTVALSPFVDEARECGSLRECPPEEVARAAMFDEVIVQTDRRAHDIGCGNWFTVPSSAGDRHLLLFDHQFCFGQSVEPRASLRSAPHDEAGHRVHNHAHHLNPLLEPAAAERLQALLPPEEVENLQRRAAKLRSMSLSG